MKDKKAPGFGKGKSTVAKPKKAAPAMKKKSSMVKKKGM
jgi:hypothetical protein